MILKRWVLNLLTAQLLIVQLWYSTGIVSRQTIRTQYETSKEMTEKGLETFLAEAIDTYQLYLEDEEDNCYPDVHVNTFENEGILTYQKGLVIRSGDSEFQISIVRSR